MKMTKHIKRVAAYAIIITMSFTGTVWAGLQRQTDVITKSQENAFAMGDVNFDGKVKLDDANLVLKAALGIRPFSNEETRYADVNFDGKVKLDDANKVLKAALGIMVLVEPVKTATPIPVPTPTAVPTATPTPTPVPTPTPTPRPTAYPIDIPKMLEPVSADAANIITGTALTVVATNGALETTPGCFEFVQQNKGVEFCNPFAGNMSLRKTVAEVTSLEAEPGKVNCWTLSGAALTGPSVDFSEMDPRIYNQEDQSTVTYTRPVWKNGVTISFWLKSTESYEEKHEEPILSFYASGAATVEITENGNATFRETKFSGSSNHLYLTAGEFLHGTYGTWNYYTVTIANDWIQVYVNGRENLYDHLEYLNRKYMNSFNDGFLSRYHSLGTITQKDIDQDVRKYYVKTTEWYWNSNYLCYMYHDNYSIFGNQRFRGTSRGAELVMNYLTRPEMKLYIGNSEGYKKSTLAQGSRIANVIAYEKELTPEQVAANYEAEKQRMQEKGIVL